MRRRVLSVARGRSGAVRLECVAIVCLTSLARLHFISKDMVSITLRWRGGPVLVLELRISQVLLKVKGLANAHDVEFPFVSFFIRRYEYPLSQE